MYIQQRDDIISVLLYAKETLKNGEELRRCELLVKKIAELLFMLNEGENCEKVKRILMKIHFFQNRKPSLKEVEQAIKDIDSVVQGIGQIQCKYRALFLPYKADMWKSMESIWRAALSDEYCEVIVMPIPYYDITNPNTPIWHYEAERFPENVEIKSYKDYIIAEEFPEMIFIHNPYDDTNMITCVAEEFFSCNLKECTKCLVYSPYFTNRNYQQGVSDYQYISPGHINSDKIIVQSNEVKERFLSFGYDEGKIMAVGSPKIDSIINDIKKPVDIPDEWEKKINGKKVFLLNTHIYYFPKAYLKPTKIGNYALWHHEQILKTFLNKEDCALIWRPHPLMEMTLKNKFPECYDMIMDIKNQIMNSENGIIDTTGDYSLAFKVSDALISTHSSMVAEYMATGKPVLIMQSRYNEEVAQNAFLNVNVNYFAVGNNKVTYDKFKNMVLMGEDTQRNVRLKEINRAFKNIDGTAGEKAYVAIRDEVVNCF